ncbi:MAG: hypothetical protein Q9226_007281 [Calogaya cf. arnoldii]
MQRDTPLTTTPAQRRLSRAAQARESRRSTHQLPAVETEAELSEEPANEAMSVNSNNLFPSFLDNNSRAPPAQQVNGNAGPMNGMNLNMPMNAGHQMDVSMLYQKILELSDMLKENREQTQAIVAGAEELATRAAANGAAPTLQEANAEISSSRIAELEQQLAHEQNWNRSVMREQKENTRLIGEYETAVGNIVEMVRNYSYNNKQERSSLSLHYNKLLQDEKDAHLAARLEKDDWHARFMRSVEMLREAYKLRCEEEEMPIRIVSGLQNEVRAYRNALGMEPEKEEEEYGWELLKDAPDAGRED